MHVVEAHTRILADGSEVFVGEHLRWNRGRHASTPRVARPRPAVPEDHPRLFDWDEPALPDPLPTPTRKGTATQLSLW